MESINNLDLKVKNQLLERFIFGVIEQHPLPWTNPIIANEVRDANNEMFLSLDDVESANFVVAFSKLFDEEYKEVVKKRNEK